jgi:hypothetical protein
MDEVDKRKGNIMRNAGGDRDEERKGGRKEGRKGEREGGSLKNIDIKVNIQREISHLSACLIVSVTKICRA